MSDIDLPRPWTGPDDLPTAADAVVIGSGPNGMVAANLLADRGWSVVVLEAAAVPGGAVRTDEVTAPGFANDLFSAFYPLAGASPIIQGLELDREGLRWVHAPEVLANPTADGPTALLSRDLGVTAGSLDAFHAGDGDGWRALHRRWERIADPVLDALFTPFPPIVPSARLAARLRVGGLMELARMGVVPVRRLAEETFRGAGGGLLLAGNALHADLAPESAASALFGWLLSSLGQTVGFPVPQGGAGNLTGALVARLRARGGRVVTASRVDRVVVRDGRAVAVEGPGGLAVAARRAVLADVGAPQLYLTLLDPSAVPPGVLDDMARFQYDMATVKVDWALDGPIPWRDPVVGTAGTVHLAESMDHLSRYAYELATRQIPSDPFVLMGQMTTTDPTRSPPGTEAAWGYTHVPARPTSDGGSGGPVSSAWDAALATRVVERVEDHVERHAPGFRSRIVARHVLDPVSMERIDANLVGGAINGGTAQIHQQLVFRPTIGRGRPETPVKGLFLASASAHPGGGVHGAPGSNAARAAVWADRRRRTVTALTEVVGGSPHRRATGS